ncbi:hypothetical protein PR003_g21625 [Phytophthora rubi]|uniref:Uncharacterized protein n=1 Tax=Phytophthora rubi TaxID=129364 RepID=A0A6A4DG42_9STRA|nr:hypothetical protein PR003_g21625 [Phytophthora rubi]
MREPAETPSEPPQFQPLLPPQFQPLLPPQFRPLLPSPQFQPLLPPQFQPSPLELVRPPFFEPPPDDAAQQHAEEAAIASLIDEVYTHPKQRRMHYSIKQKRHALLATEGLSQREAARAQKIPRGHYPGGEKRRRTFLHSMEARRRFLERQDVPKASPFPRTSLRS